MIRVGWFQKGTFAPKWQAPCTVRVKEYPKPDVVTLRYAYWSIDSEAVCAGGRRILPLLEAQFKGTCRSQMEMTLLVTLANGIGIANPIDELPSCLLYRNVLMKR
jgi:hypothetical protein